MWNNHGNTQTIYTDENYEIYLDILIVWLPYPDASKNSCFSISSVSLAISNFI